MIEIVTPDKNYAQALAILGKQTFLESHGTSASAKDLQEYTDSKYTTQVFEKELANSDSIFRIALINNQPAAYSKLIPNAACSDAAFYHYAKLERLYVLEYFFPMKIGQQLLDLNIAIAKNHNQNGIWLNVWTENKRACRFYEKNGFRIAGETSFRISATHSNPNFLMVKEFNSPQ
jgi:ribosomal protein S18 acetylase RimI-like enzyme